MPIQIYILCKLTEGNNYPYQLKKEVSEISTFDTLGYFSESKLYYHFESLIKQGLIEQVEVVKEERRPDKQMYAITEKGREHLPKKIYALFEKGGSFTDYFPGFFALQYVDKSRIVRILESKIEDQKINIAKLKIAHESLQFDDEGKRLSEITTDFFMNKFNSEIVAIQRIIEMLKEV
ncbi:PadR family transcriptional regulator [Lysinibacillus endophyticus]|uniref:PadR family transcriptional regulator n=1 Tax=Ureibacillus endophyticus TaxID=1978490 RepID=UPI0020A1E6E0|nr:PadR family transcriptional regulator [Lysinibacillus endophyticus]MCP1146817.1 PadR family transcriptional regulator [Lysinibacillus endophyticus]